MDSKIEEIQRICDIALSDIDKSVFLHNILRQRQQVAIILLGRGLDENKDYHTLLKNLDDYIKKHLYL